MRRLLLVLVWMLAATATTAQSNMQGGGGGGSGTVSGQANNQIPLGTTATTITGTIANPTTPNGVTFTVCDPVSGGASIPTTCWPGIAVTSQTGATYTLAAADRSSCVETNNAGMTLTIPDAGGTNFANAYAGCVLNLGSAVTVNNTSSSKFNLFGDKTGSLQTTFSLGANQAAYFYTSPNNNWDVSVVGAGGSIASCATTNALGIYTASTALGCGSGDFTYGTTAHTLLAGSAGLLDLSGATTDTASAVGLRVPVLTGRLNGTLEGGLAVNHNGGTNYLEIGGLAGGGDFPLAMAGGSGLISTTCTNQAFTVISGSTAPTCSSPLFKASPGTLAVTAADVTCGTGGTLAPCTALTTITGLTITLPSTLLNWSFSCDLIVSQATAAAADQIGIQTATNGATNMTAAAEAYTAAAVVAAASITDVASTTTAQSVITFTPGAAGTKVPIHLAGTIEGASASGTTLNFMALTGAAADLMTIYRGSACHVF